MQRRLIALVVAAAFVAAISGIAQATAAGAPDHKGTVTAISATGLELKTAKGKLFSFHVDGSTAYRHLDDPAARADVRVGATVQAEYTAEPDGSLRATTVVIGVATPAGSFFSTKAKGTVDVAGGGSLKITTDKGKAYAFRLGPGLAVERFGQSVAADSIRAGDAVKVTFTIGGDGTLTAASVAIGVSTTAGILYSDTEKGTVTAVAPGRLEVDTGKPPAVAFALISSTKIDRFGTKLAAAALRVGQLVKVRFRVAGSGALEADSVAVGAASVIGDLYSDTKTGTARTVSAGALTLVTGKGKAVPVRLAAKTQFARDGLPAKRGTIRAGDAVEVRFDVVAGGALLAAKVEAGRKVAGNLVFAKKQKGVVRAVSARTLTLRTSKGKTLVLRIDPQTAFEVAGVAAAASDVAVGDSVKVRYMKLRPDQAFAVRVTAGDGFRLDGRVVKAQGGSLLVRVARLTEKGVRRTGLAGKRLTVLVPATARVRVGGSVVPVERLRPGRLVHVIGRSAKGTLVARHVAA